MRVLGEVVRRRPADGHAPRTTRDANRRLPDKSIVTNKDAGQREGAIPFGTRPRSLTGAIAFIGAIRISTPGFFASFPGALRDGPFPEVTAYLDHVRFGPMIRYRRRAKNADVLFLFDHLVGTR